MADAEENVETVDNCFIDWTDFTQNYPLGNGLTRIYASNFFAETNRKIGIAHSKETRTSEEGKLYRINMTEFEREWKIIVECIIHL